MLGILVSWCVSFLCLHFCIIFTHTPEAGCIPVLMKDVETFTLDKRRKEGWKMFWESVSWVKSDNWITYFSLMISVQSDFLHTIIRCNPPPTPFGSFLNISLSRCSLWEHILTSLILQSFCALTYSCSIVISRAVI